MHMKYVTRLTPFALLAASLLAACSDDSTSPSLRSGEGTVVVKLTDAPFPTSEVQSVDVYVVRVDARTASTDDNEANQNVDDANGGGWTTLATPNAKINLLSLQNGTSTTLGQTGLAAGSYSGLRLIIDQSQSSVTLKDGTTLSGANGGIKFPSAARSGLKVNLSKPLTVVGGATTTLLIDFDVNESFVLRGNSLKNNGLLFRPVIKGTVIDAATVNANVRFVNATGTALNIAQGTTSLTGTSGLAAGTATQSCTSLNAAQPNLTFTQGTTTLSGFTPAFTAGSSYTVVAYPGATAGSVRFVTLSNTFTPTTGQSGLLVFNATGTAYDVIATPTGGTATTIANTGAGAYSSSVSLPAATSTSFVIAAPGTTTALTTYSAPTLAAGQNAILLILPPTTAGGAPTAVLLSGGC